MGRQKKGHILSIEKCNNSKTNGPIHKIQSVLKSSHKDLSDETKITKHFENQIFGVTTLFVGKSHLLVKTFNTGQ